MSRGSFEQIELFESEIFLYFHKIEFLKPPERPENVLLRFNVQIQCNPITCHDKKMSKHHFTIQKGGDLSQTIQVLECTRIFKYYIKILKDLKLEQMVRYVGRALRVLSTNGKYKRRKMFEQAGAELCQAKHNVS